MIRMRTVRKKRMTGMRADDATKSETAAADGIKEKKPDSGEKEEDDTEEARQEEETEILEELETDYEEM